MHSICAAILVLVVAGGAAAQTPFVKVSVAQGAFNAPILVTRAEPYLDGDPYAGIPVKALDGDKLVAQVRVRAWPERGATRVIVFAVENPHPGEYRETPIATFLASPGDADRVVSVAEFGAAP